MTEYRKTYNRKEEQLKGRFNMTLDQFKQMLADQNNTCALCPKIFDNKPRSIHVDHDHACCPGRISCGKCVRGLLCVGCNHKMVAVDDLEFMRNASIYKGKQVWLPTI